MIHEGKPDRRNLIKIKTFCSAKNPVKRMKRWGADGRGHSPATALPQPQAIQERTSVHSVEWALREFNRETSNIDYDPDDRWEEKPHRRGDELGREACAEAFGISTHWGDVGSDHDEIFAHMSQWLKLKTVITPNAGKDAEKLSYSQLACENVKWYILNPRRVLQILKKLNMQLAYNPAVILLGTSLGEMETDIHTKLEFRCSLQLWFQ